MTDNSANHRLSTHYDITIRIQLQSELQMITPFGERHPIGSFLRLGKDFQRLFDTFEQIRRDFQVSWETLLSWSKHQWLS